MSAPDWALSRRQLRRARVQDALTLQRVVNVAQHRDRLLERLAVYSVDDERDFDSLAEDVVDTVVSLALAELAEPADDAMAVVLLCLRVLAADGQFARLSLLADRVASLGRRWEVERPFLAVASSAFAQALKGQEAAARALLSERLGLSREIPEATVQRSREQLNDMLMAASLRSVLVSHSDRLVREARLAAMAVADGLLLAFLDAVLAWHRAVESARPLTVLAAADSTFDRDDLQRYVRGRGIQALFPAQIAAIKGGATLDENRVVSLPTSSGKTLLAEFRIAAALTRHHGSRAIYVAPYRLLSRQVQQSFSRHLSRRLGLSVHDLGSGYDATAPANGLLGDVVVCTPERLDALLRLASSSRRGQAEAEDLFTGCRVLVFDELQLIGRPDRGPRFELVMTRLRAKYPALKILGLSAATHSTADVAEWLDAGEPITAARRPTGTLEIDWEVDGTLKQRVPRRAPTTVAKLERTRAVDDAVTLVRQLDPLYRPVLVVCISRSVAENIATRIVQADPHTASKWRSELSPSDSGELATAIEEVKSLLGGDHPLATAMENGIAFHHAGVPTKVLEQIERLAARRLLRAVCSTTTVAEGADLPFRVVVIPHLNFPGASRKLERDLYLNIIGRAGRANVSVEGMVFLLDSDARTLRDLIRSNLWSDAAAGRIRGRMTDITPTPTNVDEWNLFQELQSQVMGWLGDGDSDVSNQDEVFGRQTLTYANGTGGQRTAVVSLIDMALEELENSGYALAASPYRLTDRGRAARLTGLAPPSVARMEDAIARGRNGWLRDMTALPELSEQHAELVSWLLFQSSEVFEHSLYLRRLGGSPADRLAALRAFTVEGDEAHLESDDFRADIELLTGWLMGEPYTTLAERAPVYPRANALFGGTDAPKRTSDATEYIGKLAYPASWVWSATVVLAGELGDALPAFLRGCVEHGVPSEAAVGLIARGRMTRPAAIAVSQRCGPTWEQARQWLTGEDPMKDVSLGLTRLDAGRMLDLRERLMLGEGL